MGKKMEWEIRRADGTGTPERVISLWAWAKSHSEWFLNWKNAYNGLLYRNYYKDWVAVPIIDGTPMPPPKMPEREWEISRADGTGTPERVTSLRAWAKSHSKWFSNWENAYKGLLYRNYYKGWVAVPIIDGELAPPQRIPELKKEREWEIRRADGTGTPERVISLWAWTKSHSEWFPNRQSAYNGLLCRNHYKGWVAVPIIDGAQTPPKRIPEPKKEREWEIKRKDGTGTPERVTSLSEWVRGHPEWFPNWQSAYNGLFCRNHYKGWVAVPMIDGVPTPRPTPCDPRRVCVICGAPLPKRHSRYCSEACAQKGYRVRAREITSCRHRAPVYQQRVCIDCGKTYLGHIKTKRCAACQDKAKRESNRRSIARQKSGEARKIGATDYCQQCGSPYIIQGAMQRYCKECAPNAHRANDRAASAHYYHVHVAADPRASEARNAGRRQPGTRACPICGKTFQTQGPKKYCSPECADAAYKRQIKEAEERRKAKP